jgi:uncharacterized protein (DUF433 family)
MSDQTTNHLTSPTDPIPAAVVSNGIVMRSDTGPAIVGTRISVYDIMDYLHEDWPPKLIRDWLGLTDVQIGSAITYIQEHKEQLEREYRELELEAEENRRYWEEFARNRPMPPPITDSPERAALRAKLAEFRSKLPEE